MQRMRMGRLYPQQILVGRNSAAHIAALVKRQCLLIEKLRTALLSGLNHLVLPGLYPSPLRERGITNYAAFC